MAPTEVEVARPERQWGCRRGTPKLLRTTSICVYYIKQMTVNSKLHTGSTENQNKTGFKLLNQINVKFSVFLHQSKVKKSPVGMRKSLQGVGLGSKDSKNSPTCRDTWSLFCKQICNDVVVLNPLGRWHHVDSSDWLKTYVMSYISTYLHRRSKYGINNYCNLLKLNLQLFKQS